MFRYALMLALMFGFSLDALAAGRDVPSSAAGPLQLTREHVTADVYHYSFVLPLGHTPNAKVRVHRVVREVAPFVPRHTAKAAMLLHGDFANFLTDFAPALGDPSSTAQGLAPYLAAQDIDVWGVDRRWTLTAADGDLSDFASMGVAQEVDDLRKALAAARIIRLAEGSGAAKLKLVGFSHGAQLAYTYASVEAAGPMPKNIDALATLDYFGEYAPADADLKAATCANADFEYQAVAAGETDSPNDFFIETGSLALSDPSGISPLDDNGSTNLQVALLVLGQTYLIAPITPAYHLLAPVLADGAPTGLRETREDAGFTWLAAAPPHQSMLEAADFDALLCSGGQSPFAAPLANITVPLFFIGAEGAVGKRGLYSTTQVSSREVQTLVVQQRSDANVAEDFGHGDLLFAKDAEALAWQPLALWIHGH